MLQMPYITLRELTFSGKCSAAVVLIEHKSVTFIILDCTMFPPPWQYTILALGWHTFFCEDVETLPINPAQSCQTLKPSWLSSCTVFETKLRSKYETRTQSNKKFEIRGKVLWPPKGQVVANEQMFFVARGGLGGGWQCAKDQLHTKGPKMYNNG